MALVEVNKFEKIVKDKNRLHNVVDATYSSFTTESGNKILQIDTYGSADRQFKGKISQSIQIDKKSAQELIKLLRSEFNIL